MSPTARLTPGGIPGPMMLKNPRVRYERPRAGSPELGAEHAESTTGTAVGIARPWRVKLISGGIQCGPVPVGARGALTYAPRPAQPPAEIGAPRPAPPGAPGLCRPGQPDARVAVPSLLVLASTSARPSRGHFSYITPYLAARPAANTGGQTTELRLWAVARPAWLDASLADREVPLLTTAAAVNNL